MKNLQVTIYDVVGYLIPGFVSLIAFGIFYWSAFKTTAFELKSVTLFEGIALSTMAYIAGHFTQALANMIMKLFPSTIQIVMGQPVKGKLSDEVIKGAEAKARQICKLSDAAALSASQIWEICDHLVQQKGKTEARDLYVYREGFYRGMFVSLSLLGLALFFRWCSPASNVQLDNIHLILGSNEIRVLCVSSFGLAYLAFNRYRRFGEYLTVSSIYNALLVPDEAAK